MKTEHCHWSVESRGQIGEGGIEPPSRPYDGIFVIAVCIFDKITVNYVCCHCSIPLCCPGELPGKLTLFKQDGWFFCYKERFESLNHLTSLPYLPPINPRINRRINNPIPQLTIKIGLNTDSHGQAICPVNFNPRRRPWADINVVTRVLSISYLRIRHPQRHTFRYR